MPFGYPRHSSLPTRRPESPSGLHRTKSDVRVGFALPEPNTSANFKGPRFCTTSIVVGLHKRSVAGVALNFTKTYNASSFSPLSSPKTALLVGSIGQGRPIESCGARTASRDDPLDRSPDATKWNPGLFKAGENSRITFHSIRATACYT